MLHVRFVTSYIKVTTSQISDHYLTPTTDFSFIKIGSCVCSVSSWHCLDSEWVSSTQKIDNLRCTAPNSDCILEGPDEQ